MVSQYLSFAKLGVSGFVDVGAVYRKGEHFRDATLRTGIGGSVWVTVAVLQLSLGVAHGRGGSTVFNFGGGLSFRVGGSGGPGFATGILKAP